MAAADDHELTRRQFLAGAAGLGLGIWAGARLPESVWAAEASAGPAVVNRSTYSKKLLFGYQGWHGTPGDGSAMDQWQAWCDWNTVPSPATLTVDLWPDLSGISRRHLVDSGLRYPDGSPAYLYSAYRPAVVNAHFRWMRTYGIDGVFLQEFSVWLEPGSKLRAFRDGVTANVVRAAEATGRVFALMYDVSGAQPEDLVRYIRSHWKAMERRVVASRRYLHHDGHPLVALWGLGFAGADYAATPALAHELLDFFEQRGVTVMGGVPTYWRLGIRDAKPGSQWASVFRRFAIISPWTGNRYGDRTAAVGYARLILAGDVAEAARAGAELVPVVYPGISAHNRDSVSRPGEEQPLNVVPRLGGAFWWTQMKAFHEAGATTFYGAMYDEVDEGTAMYKLAPNATRLPVGPTLLALDADGYALPSDWYLRLAGAATTRLRKGTPFEAVPPLALPGGAEWPPPDGTPLIDALTPAVAAAGQQVTISGAGFGAVQGAGYVSFGDDKTAWGAPGCAATFDLRSWSDGRIVFTVPTPSGPNGIYHVEPGSVATAAVTNAAGRESFPAPLLIGS